MNENLYFPMTNYSIWWEWKEVVIEATVNSRLHSLWCVSRIAIVDGPLVSNGTVDVDVIDDSGSMETPLSLSVFWTMEYIRSIEASKGVIQGDVVVEGMILKCDKNEDPFLGMIRVRCLD